MKKILTIILSVVSVVASAQQEYTYTFFGDNKAFFNPAAAGTNDYAALTGTFRKQWVRFEGSPTSGGLTFDMPIAKQSMGVGGVVYQDHIGVTNQTNIAGMYSYHLKITKEHKIAFGISAGLDIVNTKFDRLTYWDVSDQVLTEDYVNVVVPHIGFGAYYFFDEFYAGISVPRIVSVNSDQFNSINFSDAPSLVTHYYLTAGYHFRFKNDYSLKPSILLKYTNNVVPQGDLSLAMYYKDMIGIGLGYKSLGFLSTFIQYNLKDAVLFGYGFDFSMNPLQQYSNGSHEILIQYRFGNKKSTGGGRIQ
ncbi:type IX secretion system membrane protein PorP/SprF [Paracrocinitomix mangrovi]|uniref:PorP/SprF family type IX secretion system membrane protein n=1 Tax=Paracrocinitomix mangrovi TaxID=2862509 RepID=UPI001C8D918F|nr:type IX secretion system membrane protein PorP/SprF [Paracrocinitomix mangrovi]UKN03056.1 type IX secretion system membrane protein PorP/SprF [Paracrocinitomix mangrovi]